MPVNFGQLVFAEPRLGALLNEVVSINKENKTWHELSLLWFRDYKRKMHNLVGWYAENENPILHTHTAYDVAYEVLYSALTGD